MNQFFKFVFASCLGVTLASIAMTGLCFLLLAGLSGSSSRDKVKVSSNSILHLKFNQTIPEQTNNLEMDPFQFNSQDVLGLNDIVKSIEHAANDDKIEGIFLDMGFGVGGGLATMATVRKTLEDFTESGKFIVAFSKSYTQGSYYLASTADKIYSHPLGGIDLHGFAATIPFYKNLMDKVGVKMQIFYAGDFKSATEPYRLTEMSDSNRLQLRHYIEPVYKNFLADIGRSRGKSIAELRTMADEMKLSMAADALSNGMIDEIGYLDQVISYMKEKMDMDEKSKLKTVSLDDYANSYTIKKNYKVKDKIAVVYAEGEILHDKGDKGTIVDNDYVKIIRKLRKDKKIKAIVLRVNSPGGSAIASENIWREFKLAQEAGKPVVVSMGDYAASGGYYIACMADKIYAEPNTLTGSIGVYSMIPNMGELYNDKLGISFDTVKTSRYSVGLNVVYEMDDFEKAHWQKNTNFMYDTFLERVAEGRGMDTSAVHKIAKGRVWNGEKAKNNGLIDEIGNIEDALAAAAELADLEDYRITEYPKQTDPLQDFINEITGQKDDDAIRSKILQKEFGEQYKIYEHVKSMLNTTGVQARLPYLIHFN